MITRSQLLDAGVSASSIKRRLARGELRRLHAGTYFVGHGEPCLRARAFAALSAAGADAAISHRTAAELDRLLAPRPGPIHITAPSHRKLEGVVVHKQQIPPSQVTTGQILRRTTTVRTVMDLAATTDEATVRRALNQAGHLGIIDLDELGGLAVTARRGKRILQRALNDAARTTNYLEDRFYALLKAAGLPPPVAQFRIGPYVPDFYWPDLRLIVETDGWAGHGHSFARLDDRRRDAYFRGLGIPTERVPRRKLEHHPYLVVAELSAAIARRASGL